MKLSQNGFLCLIGALGLCAPAFATVTITALTPSVASPQKAGTVITWTATATDTGTGPLTFQFKVGLKGSTLAVVRDFNAGTLSAGTWTSPPFVWVPTGIAGTYSIEVTAQDFSTTSPGSANMTDSYTVHPLASTTPVAAKTANPLVALFGSPACASGSTQRIAFQQSGSTTVNTTNYVPCNPKAALNFEIAGMYPSKAYTMYSETDTGGTITNGPSVTFKTGALPTNITFPTFTVDTKGGDTTSPMLLLGPVSFGTAQSPLVATDLNGKVMWYYYDPVAPNYTLLTRPLANSTVSGNFPYPTMLVIQDGVAWNPAATTQQYLRELDLAGNVVRETNTGIIQQNLVKMGATDAQSCANVHKPPQIGSACLGGFHHDAIQTLPNGYTAVIASIEKIYPPGIQGDTSGLPVDIIGDMIIVLDTNWQPTWYWDSFNSTYGLNVSRAAILGEFCTTGEQGCPPILLLGTGIAPDAKDWLHANALYYWPSGTTPGDLVFSMKDQDWVIKIDYNNGTGTKKILWTMGLGGNFSFNNIFNDPYPWFSHQHEVGMENNGAGPMTLFDNGDTRVAAPPIGLGSPGCMPNDCNSRGIALSVNESLLQVSPLLNWNLGYYASADGSAQLLADGNYYFLVATILNTSTFTYYSQAMEGTPSGTTGGATTTLNIAGPSGYRGWTMTNLYNPPIT